MFVTLVYKSTFESELHFVFLDKTMTLLITLQLHPFFRQLTLLFFIQEISLDILKVSSSFM
jgi:hypothetical protein